MTRTAASSTPAPNLLAPLGSWEAAARWNAMAYEWMTRGWQQWVELVTVWPALEPRLPVAGEQAPTPAGTQEARNARALREEANEGAAQPRARAGSPLREARAVAASEGKPAARKRTAGKRAAPKRPARPQARATRSRG